MRNHIVPVIAFTASYVVGTLLSLGYIQFDISYLKRKFEYSHEDLYGFWLRSNNLTQASREVGFTLGRRRQVISESEYLLSRMSILCLVILNNKRPVEPFYMPQMLTASEAIGQTWGQRCSEVRFFCASNANCAEKVTRLNVRDATSWSAYREIFTSLTQQDLELYEWYVVAEDNTFVIVENLAYYLAAFNVSEPCYFGHVHRSWGTSYNTAGSSFVLSRQLLLTLQRRSLSKGHCEASTLRGDLKLGECLQELSILPMDTRDERARARFLPFEPEQLLVPNNIPLDMASFLSSSLYPSVQGPDCCSDNAVSFSGVTPNMMLVYDYLLYSLSPHGISSSLIQPYSVNHSNS